MEAVDGGGSGQGPTGTGWAWDGADWARYLEHVRVGEPAAECPALLIGDGESSIRVRGHLPVKVGSGPNFVVDAATLLDAEDLAATLGLRVVGLAHYHPEGGEPSDFDREVARLWPGAVLLLVRGNPPRCERVLAREGTREPRGATAPP